MSESELRQFRATINLNGEFLGVTALACYSAPTYLQVMLLVLIGFLFYFKVAADSRRVKETMQQLVDQEHSTGNSILQDANQFFFGFTVARKNLAAYWIGFALFLITLVHAFVISAIEIVEKSSA